MKYYMLTLGCAKNVADSDGIGALLERAGYSVAEHSRDADVLIVNTCGFLQASRQESLGALRDLGDEKRNGQLLIAAGCLISRYGETVQKEVPQVDGVIDAGRWLALPRFLEYLRGNVRATGSDWMSEAYAGLPGELSPRIDGGLISARSVVEPLPRKAIGPSAYLKIADGCDRPCTFCIIPAIKGAHRSKPIDAVVAEARDLVAQGVKEIVLVAQDTTAYGWDWGKRDVLATLIERLCGEVEGLQWLRLMYTYPGHITPRLIETIGRCPQALHYIDVPLQHAHPETLKRMQRPNINVTRLMLDSLRAALPDVSIRTTFIVGFPGETDEEFQGLLEFLQEQGFDRVGVFEYSKEEGTPAATLAHQVSRKVKERRREEAMARQQKISLAKNQHLVGKELDVLIEGSGDGITISRSYRDAPEVDGVVIIQKELPVGQFMRVRVTQAMEYDLMAVPVEQHENG
jgi:ribosomal protein S12 methylthiotransferase